MFMINIRLIVRVLGLKEFKGMKRMKAIESCLMMALIMRL